MHSLITLVYIVLALPLVTHSHTHTISLESFTVLMSHLDMRCGYRVVHAEARLCSRFSLERGVATLISQLTLRGGQRRRCGGGQCRRQR